jgi:hypothetical protein
MTALVGVLVSVVAAVFAVAVAAKDPLSRTMTTSPRNGTRIRRARRRSVDVLIMMVSSRAAPEC